MGILNMGFPITVRLYCSFWVRASRVAAILSREVVVLAVSGLL